MADHTELVSEMTMLEQMGTQERQKLARKRRSQQIKKWSQREKEWLAKERQLSKKSAIHEDSNGLNLKNYTSYGSNNRNNIIAAQILQPNGRVHFDDGVMLLEAAARNDIDEVRRLLTLGVSPDSTNHDGLTALHQCCVDAFEPMMKLLIEFGADVNAKDSEQWTPLHAACTCNHPNIVKYLVNSGADLLAVNGDGNMPFDICEDEAILDHIESEMVKRNITQEIVDYTRASTEIKMMEDLQKFIADSGDINAKDKDGITQLHIAAANGYASVVKHLLDHGADVDSRDCDYWTPLHGAACWGTLQHAKVIELLVQAGADINAKTLNGEAPLDICDNPEIRERLVQLKDEIETKHASTTSNLRRTQSRTNSRTHSVRRTSIREKAQISRREAREEALLRQETNPSQNNSDEDSNAIGDNNSSARLQLVNGASKENSSNYQFHNESTAQLDQQGERTTNDENQNTTSLSYSKANYDDTDIVLENGVNMKSNKLSYTNADSENLTNSMSNTQKTNISRTTDPNKIYSNGSNGDKHDVMSNQQDIEINEQMTSNQNGHLSSRPPEKIGQMDEAFKPNHFASINSSNETNTQQTQSLTNQISPQSSLVFASINCTLSDLKKQRSDLRHRNMNLSLSLPESNSDPKITKNDLTHFPHQPSDVPDSAVLSTKSLNNDDPNSIELDRNVIRTSNQVEDPIISNNLLVSDKSPKIDSTGMTMNNNTNSFEELDKRPVKDNLKLTFISSNGFPKGDLPPPSPSQALRKFRGDPSEVVGGKERYRTRKCCILF